MTVLRPSPAQRAVLALTVSLAIAACATTPPALARDEEATELPAALAPTYVDLVEWALSSDLVAIVTVDDQIAYNAERAPDVPANRVRLYVESQTRSLLAANGSVGEELVFVVDLNRDSDGDVPDLEGRDFILFGDRSNTPGGVQLLSSDSLVPAGPAIEARVRTVLTQMAAAELPPTITGVRDVISVPGNLAGESETQMFVQTTNGTPVSLSVVRRPGRPAQWGVSLGEIVNLDARPPAPETLAWYRFACSLPPQLPADSFLQTERESQAQARQDYAFILAELGPCERRYR